MGKKSFLVLGKAAPEGDTAYVLSVEENGEQWLWNATTAEHFNISETFCPLESVYAIVNDGKLIVLLFGSSHPGVIVLSCKRSIKN